MHKDINQTVRDNYLRYQSIGDKVKTLESTDIVLQRDQNHARSQEGDVALTFPGDDECGRLNVSLNVDKTKSFAFKIFCDDLMPEPCYRFDSDGPSHTNPPAANLVLRKRRVHTPHFHKYDQDGRLTAYTTDELASDETSFVGDYQKAIKHFFDEERVSVEGSVRILTETLPWGDRDFEDPLEGVEFK